MTKYPYPRHQTTLAPKEQEPINTREINLEQQLIAASLRAGTILGTLCRASYA